MFRNVIGPAPPPLTNNTANFVVLSDADNEVGKHAADATAPSSLFLLLLIPVQAREALSSFERDYR